LKTNDFFDEKNLIFFDEFLTKTSQK